MKKKAAIFATAAVLVLSLAACGNQGNGSNTNNSGNGGTTSGTQNNGGSTTGGSTNGGSTTGGSTNGGSTNGGSTNGGSTTGGNTSGGSTTGGSTNGGNTNGGANSTRSGMSNGVRSAVDDAGRVVDDLVDDVTGTRSANGMSSFEKMLDNARVHDVDGVLTDGENANW